MWRDQLRPASFRGVPFFVERMDTTTSLRADVHEFPGRDSAEESVVVRDLGRGGRRFIVSAYVVGDDYIDRRNALEEALAQGGPGRLVHPYRGERTVSVVGEVRVTELPTKGGHAAIRFTCIDVSETGLRSRADTDAIAERDLDAYIEDLARDFDTSYEDTLPEAFQASSVSAFSDALDGLRDAHRQISEGIGVLDDFSTRVREFENALTNFASAPGAAASALLGAFQTVTSLPRNVANALESSLGTVRTAADEVLESMRDLMSFGSDAAPLPETTENRLAEIASRRAVFGLVQGGAVAHTARAVLRMDFSSRDHALGIRDALDDEFVRLAEGDVAGGSTVSGAILFQRLQAARVATRLHLASVASDLPDLREYVVPYPLPTLVIAHELYGDARREAEIVGRNAVRSPALVRPGTALEVTRE